MLSVRRLRLVLLYEAAMPVREQVEATVIDYLDTRRQLDRMKRDKRLLVLLLAMGIIYFTP